jgi:hypothetical protein
MTEIRRNKNETPVYTSHRRNSVSTAETFTLKILRKSERGYGSVARHYVMNKSMLSLTATEKTHNKVWAQHS